MRIGAEMSGTGRHEVMLLTLVDWFFGSISGANFDGRLTHGATQARPSTLLGGIRCRAATQILLPA